MQPSIERAAAYMEPVDVRNGEYEAVFDETGRRYSFEVVTEGSVESTRLAATEHVDLDELRSRLSDEMSRSNRTGLKVEDVSPLEYAADVSRWQWERRWPKRPRWLSRRLHGDGPEIQA